MNADGELTAPADFTGEELALAHDLRHFFSVEQEQLPPHFVQTLAIEEGAWFPSRGLEQRVTYHVFQRLYLPRRLFAPRAGPAVRGPRGLKGPGHAPRLIALSTLIAMLLLSVIATAPSFAQGLRLMLGKTGAQVARHYPQPILALQDQAQSLSLQAVSQAVPFHVYWFGLTNGPYQFQNLVLHVGQPWADGPVVEFQYSLASSPGSGGLVLREFRPQTGNTVLQVVAQGAAHAAQVAGQPALYIDGQWTYRDRAMVWQYGTQAELLYQSNGLIFWITADQRDGAGARLLEAWASTIFPLYLNQTSLHLADQMQPGTVLPASAQIASPLSPANLGEVIALLPAGVSPETGAAVYIALGSPPDGMD